MWLEQSEEVALPDEEEVNMSAADSFPNRNNAMRATRGMRATDEKYGLRNELPE